MMGRGERRNVENGWKREGGMVENKQREIRREREKEKQEEEGKSSSGSE